MRGSGLSKSVGIWGKRLLIALVGGFLLGTALGNEDLEKWKQVLGEAKGEVPAPSFDSVVWRTDPEAAMAEAADRGLPLLVTWRCIPCKQCAAFDKNVLEGSPSLTPLLRRYVTVRMTDAAALDERYFPYRSHQDLDLSWWAYLLSPEGELYGVFGGKDHVSDATRISEQAFVNTLDRVLKHHYDPRRSSWGIDRKPAKGGDRRKGPKDSGSYARYSEDRPWMAQQSCMHCHQVGDLLHIESMDAGTFEVHQLTQPWPLPENIGLEIDRDHGLNVTSVRTGSPADQAGLKVGDLLGMANQVRLFGQADLRGVLHRMDFGAANLKLAWERDGELQVATLVLSERWRETENRWRKTVYDGVYGPRMGFFPIKGPNQGKGKMSFKPFMGKKAQESPLWSVGLRPQMEIVEINGRAEDWNRRELLGGFRLNHRVGDEVVLRVRQGGKESEVRFTVLGPPQ